MSVSDEIRRKLNIVDLISEYVSLEKKGREYKGLCPFHNEKTPSFHVSEEKQVFHCFGCQKGGDIFKFLCEYENLSYPEAMEILAKKAGVSLQDSYRYRDNEAFHLKKNLLELYKQAAHYYVNQLYGSNQTAARYLISRGLNRKTAISFGLGYAGNSRDALYLHLKSKGWDDSLLLKSGLFLLNKHGKITDLFRNRLIFPILDKRSLVIAFGGRVMTKDASPKYVNSPETDIFSKKNNLYGIHIASKSKKGFFIACEGYMDVIALNHAGYDNAVASLGTALTSAQLGLIKNYTNYLYFMYDSDEAGRKAVQRAIPIAASAGLYLKVVSLAPYKDPDEFVKALGAEELQARIEEAKNPVFFQADALYENVSVTDPDSRSMFHDALANILSDIMDRVSRENYIKACAHRYSQDEQLLRNTVNKTGYAKEVKAYNKKEREQDFSVSKTDNRYSLAQAMLLAWMIDERRIYDSVKEIIEAEDFTHPLFQKTYEIIHLAYQEQKEIPYHEIMDRLSDEDSSIMSGILTKGGNFTKDENVSVTLKELVIKVKTESYNRFRQTFTQNALQETEKLQANKKLTDKKKYIEKLKVKDFILS